jgi:NhaP-type Na+/H+ or K+/H+ antiporter
VHRRGRHRSPGRRFPSPHPGHRLLLGLGFLVGPVLCLLHPSQAFGPNLRPLIGLAVAIVVFEGGLALDFRELRAAGEGVLRLTAIALPINFVLGTVAAHLVGGMLWGPSAVFGAILVVTGPTVILPLLRHARLERRSAGAALGWSGARPRS